MEIEQHQQQQTPRLKRLKSFNSKTYSWEKWNCNNNSKDVNDNSVSLVDMLFDLDDDFDIDISSKGQSSENGIDVDIIYLESNQFDFYNGATACTSISFVTCLHFLKKKDPIVPNSMTWKTIMRNGASLWTHWYNSGGWKKTTEYQHAKEILDMCKSIAKIKLEVFKEYAGLMTNQTTEKHRGSYALTDCIKKCTNKHKRWAAVFTCLSKSSCIMKKEGEDYIYVFDPHIAFVARCKSPEDATKFLCEVLGIKKKSTYCNDAFALTVFYYNNNPHPQPPPLIPPKILQNLLQNFSNSVIVIDTTTTTTTTTTAAAAATTTTTTPSTTGDIVLTS
jgi:hypothetical protein